ncbi:hypothetical protein Daus18300_001056 [Diaporthe australafricana]|uniref:Uncharacterized protein n=1 Tax=Diaporthe australafricana TaxID=127596 RepID=A0ABR3XZV7_9PEZI
MATIGPQTSRANEATINTKTGSDEDPTITVLISATHEECHGLVDPEGEPPIGIGPQQIDKNLRCAEVQEEEVDLGPLSEITMKELRKAIENVIEQGGDHDLDGLVKRHFRCFDFVSAEEDNPDKSLFNCSDEDLQRVLAGGKGCVQVVWYF